VRLVFLGTPALAVPSLRALAAGPHEVVGVVSQPDRPRGRGRRVEATPVCEAAASLCIPTLQPESIGSHEAIAWLRDLRPDLGVVVAFGQFIPKAVRELPRLGMINAHASLLPRHRGAAPIQAAILAGDAETGVSVMRVVREMDAGAYCLTRATALREDETAGELAERIAELASRALAEGIAAIAAGTAVWTEQDPAAVTWAPKLDRRFGVLDFQRPRAEILRRIRAASPRPGCDVTLAVAGRTLRIVRARAYPGSHPQGASRAEGVVGEDAAPLSTPGTVCAREGELLVAAGDGWIALAQVQVPGRRPVTSAEILRGMRLAPHEHVAPTHTRDADTEDAAG
jgi:methionyl-tRNA formyltransferase